MANTEYRKARAAEGPMILDFINMVFSMGHEPHDFSRLLPKVYAHEDLWKVHYVAVRDGKVLATVALLPLELSPVPGVTLKAGFVGSVSVHPYFRHEGHMKALLTMILEDARRENYDLLVLGGQRQRYGYFGFGKADPVLNYEIRGANVRHGLKDTDVSGVTFEPLKEDMAEELEKIRGAYLAGGNTCERGDRLFEYLGGWNAVPEVIRDNGKYIGYLCRNGAEVYEMELDDPGLIRTVIRAFTERNGSMKGCLPLYGSAYRKGIAEIAEEVNVGDLAMIRVLNWARVLETYMTVRSGIRSVPDGTFGFSVKGEGSFRIRSENGKISVNPVNGGNGETMTPEKAVDLFFSVGGAVNCEDPWLKPLLPLPFHMGTMDHF